jgi:hypothetical protein
MSASPLVPVPDKSVLSTDRGGVEMTVSPNGAVLLSAGGDSVAFGRVPHADAPALAAAILAAAGCENHRVIDLGGPLPQVRRGRDGAEQDPCWEAGDVAIYDVSTAERIQAGIRSELAVLEARAATPQHDPAEVETVARALAKANGTPWDLIPPGQDNGEDIYRRDARAVLDALAKVRAER